MVNETMTATGVTADALDRGVAEDAMERLAFHRVRLENQRDGMSRSDPRGRHLSLAITALEDAELRVNHALGMAVRP